MSQIVKIPSEKTIFDVLHSKQVFLNNEICVSKTHKIGIFAKGLVHGFGQKVEVFHLLCLSKIDREKVFADVLDQKEAFKDYKNNCVRKMQN